MIAAAWAWLSGSALGRWALAAGAFIVALAGSWFLGKREGRKTSDAEHEAEDHEVYQDAVETRRTVEDRIRRAGDGTAADELRRDWSRPD